MRHKNLVFVLTVVVGLCGVGRADEAEDRAVAAAEKLGGRVIRSQDKADKPVVSLNLTGAEVTEAVIRELAPLKGLTLLNLSFTDVTDAGLKELAPFKALTELYLEFT